jgi:hypothetical protein
MRERVANVGGSIAFESAPGCGLSISAQIPLPPEFTPGAAPVTDTLKRT